MRSLLTAARLVRGATAGIVLRADGGSQALPGLQTDALLAPGSPVLATARDRIDEGDVYSSFLWPLGGSHAPGGHVRVTVLAAPEDVPPGLTGMALLSPAPDLHGLTPRELEVLGLLVEGCCNHEIARALVVAPRTVAAHLEHVLAKLGAPTRTLAAVRAERDGLYVPPRSAGGRA
jgi:DNA-binding CsgD family transcriptional regulator